MTKIDWGSTELTIVLLAVIFLLALGNLAISVYRKGRRGPGPR